MNEKRRKVAAFDFVSHAQSLHDPLFLTTAVQQDSTLILTASGKKFASDAQDWKWWHPSVPGILRKLYLESGYAAPFFLHATLLILKLATESLLSAIKVESP
jgi:bifunctional polynucleotide phosphatase/kinase